MATFFTKRTTKPNSKNKEYIRTAKGGWSQCVKGSPTDSVCDVLSNCVGYACGRFNEIINEICGTTGMRYPYLNCNAEDWIERVKKMYPELQFSDKPQRGAIICWRKGQAGTGSDGAGHVAIVEEVIDDNTIITSESAYGGSAFYVSTRKNDNGRWGLGSAYAFRAFILNPEVKLVEPVPRDEYVNQVDVSVTLLRLRKSPTNKDMSNYLGCYCPLGIFNVLSVEENDGYTWYCIDKDVWIAGVEGVTLLKKKTDDELAKLRLENAELKARLEEIRKAGGWNE